MLLLPPSSTRTDTLFPYPTLFRSNDVGVSVDLYRGIGDTVLFAGACHDWLGDSPRIQADTQQRASVGFSHRAGRGQWGLKYEQRSALVEQLEGRRDATVFYSLAGRNGRDLRLSLNPGRSDGKIGRAQCRERWVSTCSSRWTPYH